jgi:hypothetical protein
MTRTENSTYFQKRGQETPFFLNRTDAELAHFRNFSDNDSAVHAVLRDHLIG